MLVDEKVLTAVSALERLFKQLNNTINNNIGEQILLLDFKLRCLTDLHHTLIDDQEDLIEFEDVRLVEFGVILDTYRNARNFERLKILFRNVWK